MRHTDINGALELLSKTSVFPQMLDVLNNAPRTTSEEFRKRLEVAWRDHAAGWSEKEFKFTAIQPPGRGRPRAIDFFCQNGGIGVELELSNQNAVSHDFLKLETAYWNQLTKCGILIVPMQATRSKKGWRQYRYYATYEYAEEWIRIFANSLRSPIAVCGI